MLLVSSDLNARARISKATEQIGAEWDATSVDGLLARLGQGGCDILILDLDAGIDAVVAAVAQAGNEDLLPPSVGGYYSHVDEETAARAQAAGIKPVRRGRFWTQLTSYLS